MKSIKVELNWEYFYKEWDSLSDKEKDTISNALIFTSLDRRRELFSQDSYARLIYIEKLYYFDNEEDLLLRLYKNKVYEYYPLVKKIAQTILTPDIDLLQIERRHGEEELSIGYEIKVLNLKRNVYRHFYEGLGEAISYFKYGINRVYLIIGISQIFEKYEDLFRHISSSFESLRKLGVIPEYVGIKIFGKRLNIPASILEPRSTFDSYDKNYRFYKEALVRKEFLWAKKWEVWREL